MGVGTYERVTAVANVDGEVVFRCLGKKADVKMPMALMRPDKTWWEGE